MVSDAYTGPAYWLVNAVDERAFDLVDMHGARVATYPTAELAHKVRLDLEKKAVRAYLSAQKRRAKMDAATVNRKVDAILRKNPRESIKAPKSMSAAAINAELDKLDAAYSSLLDRMIAAGDYKRTNADLLKGTDKFSREFQDISDRRFALNWEIKKRTGTSMQRLPRGFGPLKDNPGGKRVTLLAQNPRKTDKRLRANKPASSAPYLKFQVSERRSPTGEWVYTAGFHKESDAVAYAKHLHGIRPDMFFQVSKK